MKGLVVLPSYLPKGTFFLDEWEKRIENYCNKRCVDMGEELEMEVQQVLLRNDDGSFSELGRCETTQVTAEKCAENPFKAETHFYIQDEMAFIMLIYGDRINKLVSRMGEEWKDKFYKNYEKT